jgi:hypothetical protein
MPIVVGNDLSCFNFLKISQCLPDCFGIEILFVSNVVLSLQATKPKKEEAHAHH